MLLPQSQVAVAQLAQVLHDSGGSLRTAHILVPVGWCLLLDESLRTFFSLCYGVPFLCGGAAVY